MSLEKRKKERAGPAHPGEEGAQALDNWRKYGAVSSIATLLFVKLYGDIGATLSTVVVTVVVLILGDWTFDDFCSYFHIADDADSVSLGGWIMVRMEKVPAAGESFEYGGLSITVEEISNNRIQKVRVVQLEQPQEEDSEKKTGSKRLGGTAQALFFPFCPESPTLYRRNYPGWANAGEAPRQRHRGPPGSAKKGPARGAPALLESYKPITGGYFASTGCLAGDSSRTTTLSMRWSSIFSTWRATPSISMSSCSPSLGMALRRVTIRPPRVS